MASNNNGSREPVSRRPVTKTKPKTPRTKTTKKAPVKRKVKRKVKGKTPTLKRKICMLLLQLSIVVGVAIAFYGYYLDGVIKRKFNQGLWNLPSIVYGRTMTLSPDAPYTLAQIKTALSLTQYTQVTKPVKGGEFSVSDTSIELFRRGFEYDDGFEGARHVKIDFVKGHIDRVTDLKNSKVLGYLRMEPKMLGMVNGDPDEKRLFMPREMFPELLIDTLLATEDRDFFHHYGVRPLTILRAVVVNIMKRKMVQGGSTLTQQLAKNVFLTRERTLVRKLKEAYIALLLERQFSKDQILEAYLNEIYLGQDGVNEIHGFPLASQFYFNKPMQELTLDQIAMLIAVVKGPSYYNPWKYSQRVKERRNVVLQVMSEQDPPIISKAEYQKLISKPLGIQKKGQIAKTQPAYLQLLNREIIAKIDPDEIKKGVRIFSTQDPLSQQALEEAAIATSPELIKKAGSEQLQMGAVIADRETGEVRAIIGGRDPKMLGFNRALDIRRQIGSNIKPIVYLSALLQPDRFQLATTLADAPININGWRPQNYERRNLGQVPLITALAKSYNVPTVNLGMAVGLDEVTTVINKLVSGVSPSKLPSMLLGAIDMSPLQVVEMFQPIANRGKKAQLTTLSSIVTQEGRLLYQQLPSVKQVVPEQAAWLTLYAMQRVVSEGTGRILQKEYPWAHLAGKTGTTNNNIDSWFMGIDQKEVVSIWVGRDDNQPSKLTGASGGLVVYRNYLKRRGPAALQTPWPPEITINKYNEINGAYIMDCNGLIKLPVWDPYKTQQTSCQQSSRRNNEQNLKSNTNKDGFFDNLFK